jgi:hypothetical protein
MHIKRENNAMIMSELLVCVNYGDRSHINYTFEKVGDNEYKCTYCEAVLIVKEPVLVLDDRGGLKMQVFVGTKEVRGENE